MFNKEEDAFIKEEILWGVVTPYNLQLHDIQGQSPGTWIWKHFWTSSENFQQNLQWHTDPICKNQCSILIGGGSHHSSRNQATKLNFDKWVLGFYDEL